MYARYRTTWNSCNIQNVCNGKSNGEISWVWFYRFHLPFVAQFIVINRRRENEKNILSIAFRSVRFNAIRFGLCLSISTEMCYMLRKSDGSSFIGHGSSFSYLLPYSQPFYCATFYRSEQRVYEMQCVTRSSLRMQLNVPNVQRTVATISHFNRRDGRKLTIGESFISVKSHPKDSFNRFESCWKSRRKA